MKRTKRNNLRKTLIPVLSILTIIIFLGTFLMVRKYNSRKESIHLNESRISMSDKNNIKDDYVTKDENNNIDKKEYFGTTPLNKDKEASKRSSFDFNYDKAIASSKFLSISDIAKLTATSIVDTKQLDTDKLNSYFYSEEISDDVYQKILGNSYKKDCTIRLKDLRYVRVLYHGFDNKTHIGELIIHKDISKDVCNIMNELYDAKYPIERMELIDDFNADDEASMNENNSSSFNYRTISGTSKLSNHSKGLAIDINPLYNPYVKTVNNELLVSPIKGSKYVDRSLACPYLIRETDICYQTFIKYGFTWGGSWHTCKDYQHFEKNMD